MKKIFNLIVAFVLLTSVVPEVNAQGFLSRLKDRVIEKVKEKIEDKVDRTIDKAADDVLDGNSDVDNSSANYNEDNSLKFPTL